MNCKLYIGNLPQSVSEQELGVMFSAAGAVAAVELMLDPATGQSRGFAFVTMATPESAAAALNKFHGYKMGGRHVTVTEARPPQETKGLVSEGFDTGLSSSFRPGRQQRRNRKGLDRPGRGTARGG